MSRIWGHLPELRAALLVALALLAGLLARRALLQRLGRLAGRTRSSFDDALVSSLRRPLPLWFTLGGLLLATRTVRLPPEQAALAAKVIAVCLVLSLTWWASELAGHLLGGGGAARDGGAPVAGVIRHTVRLTVMGLGGLVLLSTLGISIAPVLTTLGIGGLALALGLQDTLTNLFAGVHLTLAGNLRVGDFVRLESGEEGYVEDIGWRATRVQTLPGNLVLIPNGRLAQTVVTNYDRPTAELAVLVQLGVHYASDLAQVERVTTAVGRDVMRRVPGGVPEFEPFVRYHTFGESSIDFTVILRARRFTDNFVVKHEFVKALTSAYAGAGIVIPFPIRALDFAQEAGGAGSERPRSAERVGSYTTP